MTASAELVRPRQRVEEERRQLPRTRPAAAAAAITAAQLGSRVAICTLPDASPSDPASAEPLRTRRGSLAPSLGTGPAHSRRWQPFLPDAPHVGHSEPERGRGVPRQECACLSSFLARSFPQPTPPHLPGGLFFFLLLRMRRTGEIIAWGS